MRRLLVAAALFLVTGCSSDLSASARDCVDEWNHDGPHATVAAESFVAVELAAGENKALQAECGLLFHSGEGDPWRIYWVVWEEGVRGPGGSVSGSAWGTDSPEGSIDATIQVRPDGTLVG